MTFKLITVILVATSAIFAQNRDTNTSRLQTTPGNCETNAALLDSVRTEALQQMSNDKFIFAIARLGDGELSRDRNRLRLRAVKNYLTTSDLPARMLVTAEGERIKGYGRVELYVNGELRVVLLANRNKLLCVDCCDPSKSDFYSNRNKP